MRRKLRHSQSPGHQVPDLVRETVQGRIHDWTENHHGDIDGFYLDSGPLVRFPPHLGSEITEILSDDLHVTVHGVWHAAQNGEVHIVASTIESADRRISVDIANVPLRQRRVATNIPIRLSPPNPSGERLGVEPDGCGNFEDRLVRLEQQLRELFDSMRHLDDRGDVDRQ